MSDITKCNGGLCPVRYNCWRYTAPSNERWQSWAMFYKPDRTCEHYWPVETVYIEDEVREKRNNAV